MKENLKEANQKLIHILSTIRPSWGDKRLDEIQRVIKSTDLNTKLYIIKKYEKL